MGFLRGKDVAFLSFGLIVASFIEIQAKQSGNNDSNNKSNFYTGLSVSAIVHCYH